MDKNLISILETGVSQKENRFNTKHDESIKTGYFYHITQQCWNQKNFYSCDAARYRTNLYKTISGKYEIVPIMSVVMPSHSHDVIYVKEFDNCAKFYISLNTNVSHFIKQERRKLYGRDTDRVFHQRPTYTIIENREQLLYLFYYLYHNPDYLKSQEKAVPYSCFDDWKKENFKGFNVELFNYFYSMNVLEIIQECERRNKQEFQDYCFKKCSSFRKNDKKLFFKK